MLIERIGGNCQLNPFSSTRDDRQNGRPGRGDPHVMLQLCHMLCGSSFFRKIPGQHEFGFENCPSFLYPTIECCGHPAVYRMKNLLLHVRNELTRIFLVPAPVQWFGNVPELD